MTMRVAPRRAEWWRLEHLAEPDFSSPPPALSVAERERLRGRLLRLYGEETAARTLPELERRIGAGEASGVS
jgi:hypothetical protein